MGDARRQRRLAKRRDKGAGDFEIDPGFAAFEIRLGTSDLVALRSGSKDPDERDAAIRLAVTERARQHVVALEVAPAGEWALACLATTPHEWGCTWRFAVLRPRLRVVLS